MSDIVAKGIIPLVIVAFINNSYKDKQLFSFVRFSGQTFF